MAPGKGRAVSQHRPGPDDLPDPPGRWRSAAGNTSHFRGALFDKLGMRTIVLETDPFGNFLNQGYEFASARDWARLGNL
jgi:hypothetical protein